MQDMDIAVQLGQWIPFSAWTPNKEVLFLPQLENQLLLRLHHCGAVRARVECSGLPLEVDNNNWESSLKLIHLQLHKKLPKNSMSTILWSFGIWSKLEGRKSSVRGCLTSWLQLKKIIILRCHLLVFYATVINWFSIRFWCATKSGLCTTAGNNQLSGWTEKKLRSTSQSQICTRKKKERTWSLFGGLLLLWSTAAFWVPVKPLHLRSILSKSLRCTKNCNACSWHWSTERAQFFSMMMPDCMSHNQCFKSWTNWARKFCLIHHIYLISHQLTTTSSSISTTFCREKVSTTSRMQKILSKTSLSSWSIDFYATGISKLNSRWQKSVDYNRSYFD